MLAVESQKTLPAKTLYLDGIKSIRVLRDGPALRVRQVESADRLFPLRYLRRVVVCGQVEWATDALLACAEAQIPVSFVSCGGTLRGRMTGWNPVSRVISLQDVMEMLLEQKDGLVDYHNWVSGTAQQERVKLVRNAGRNLWPTQPMVLRRLLFEQCIRYAKTTEVRRLDCWLYSLLTVHLSELLEQYGLNCSSDLFMVYRMDPLKDFVSILVWSLQNDKIRYIKRLYTQARRQGNMFPCLTRASAARFYESQSKKVEQSLSVLIRRFHLYLLERTSPHGKQ